MSFFTGGSGGDMPMLPTENSPKLKNYMRQWRKDQKARQGMESTILTSWSGAGDENTNKTILGDAWLTT